MGEYVSKTAGLIISILGGMLLELPMILLSLEPYISVFPQLPEEAGTKLLLAICLLFSIIIPIIVVLYKSEMLRKTVVRIVIMFVSFFLTVIINGYAGTILCLYNLLQITPYDPVENIIGVFQIMYIVVVLFNSVAAIVLNTVIKRLIK